MKIYSRYFLMDLWIMHYLDNILYTLACTSIHWSFLFVWVESCLQTLKYLDSIWTTHHSHICAKSSERDVFVFPSGLNSLLKVYVLNKIIVSPVLSWPLVAKQPCLPEGHSSSLCTDAYGWCTTPGGWKAPTSPSQMIANQSVWHTALVADLAVD